MDIKLIADLRYLRVYYGWDDKDAREVMQSIKESSGAAYYYTVLSAAHRAGYEPNEENNFIRLRDWCVLRGLGEPFAPHFDLAALDAMAIDQRIAA